MTSVLVNNKLLPTEVMEEIALKLTMQCVEWENIEGDMYLVPPNMHENNMMTVWAHADHMNEIPALDDLPLTHTEDISTHGVTVSVYEEFYIDVTFLHVLVVNTDAS
jgi:hypothetical protein